MRPPRSTKKRRVLRPSSPPAAGVGVRAPFVAIVGRPNVGKSTLFNRLMNRRIAIVERTAGTTRDRVSALLALEDGRRVELCDTGGLGGTADPLDKDVDRQIRIALERADLVIFVVDARAGATPLDEEIARRLLRMGKPIVLAANKAETQQLEDLSAELWRLGCGEPLAVSAKEGIGRQELLARIGDGLKEKIPAAPEGSETPILGGMPQAPRELRVAVVGRRNAGKSSFVNALFGDERVIVSDKPGTTRDAVDVRVVVDGESIVLIDTAGLRKRGKADDAIELISHGRAREAIRRCDVALVLLDALRDLSEVDKKIAELVASEHKGLVFVATKWDLVENRMTPEQFSDYVRKKIPTIPFAPVTAISSTTGMNVKAPIDLARELYRQSLVRVPTAQLNRVLQDALVRRRPRIQGNQTPKLYFATQVATNPVTIIIMVNKPALFDREYRRYLANELRRELPYSEVPIKLALRERRGLLERGLARRVRARSLEKTEQWIQDEHAPLSDDVARELDHDDVRAALADELTTEEIAERAAEAESADESPGEEDAPPPPSTADLLYGEDADVVRRKIERKRAKRGKRRDERRR